MIRNYLVRILLLPFSLLFGFFVSLRDGLYRYGLLRSVRFNIPVIGIGNLSLGGSGKTPHVEYLIRLLEPFLEIGILSRGYQRKTKGFKMIGTQDDALTAGDEPMQYRLKFPNVKVAVSESRSLGIPLLLHLHPEVQTILLDDSYQHRSVEPGLNILLTEYDFPYTSDFLLPAGRLREWRSGADRADVIVVTKCPKYTNPEIVPMWKSRLELRSSQHLFFSKYTYERPYNLFSGLRKDLAGFDRIILLCAIANEAYLLTHLEEFGPVIQTMIYEDHHLFSPHEISLVNNSYQNLPPGNNAVITTEKDATRLYLHQDFLRNQDLPIYVLPVRVEFLFGSGPAFDEAIKRFLLNFKS